jgi:hypothetical protein
MVNHKCKLLILVMLSVFALCFVCAKAQTSPPSPAIPPLFSPGPLTPYSAATQPSTDVLRFRRGERYNSPNSPLPGLGEESDATLVSEEMGDYYRDPMPVSQSDAVVVGIVKDGQAYLSNDRRDIYTEFNIVLQEVVKAPSGSYLRADDTSAVERNGGAIRLPSGKVLIRAAKDYSMPLIGKRYLLFLRYNGDSTEDYHLLTGYQLEGSQVYRLDDLDYAYAARHHGDLAHPLRKDGANETQLLQQARSADAAKIAT